MSAFEEVPRGEDAVHVFLLGQVADAVVFEAVAAEQYRRAKRQQPPVLPLAPVAGGAAEDHCVGRFQRAPGKVVALIIVGMRQQPESAGAFFQLPERPQPVGVEGARIVVVEKQDHRLALPRGKAAEGADPFAQLQRPLRPQKLQCGHDHAQIGAEPLPDFAVTQEAPPRGIEFQLRAQPFRERRRLFSDRLSHLTGTGFRRW